MRAVDLLHVSLLRSHDLVGRSLLLAVLRFRRLDLDRFDALAIEVKNELEARCEAARPIAHQTGALIPAIETEATPPDLSHEAQPVLPVRLPLVRSVDDAEIHKHLSIVAEVFDEMLTEDAIHELIPIARDLLSLGGIVPLLRVRWRREEQASAIMVKQLGNHVRIR